MPSSDVKGASVHNVPSPHIIILSLSPASTQRPKLVLKPRSTPTAEGEAGKTTPPAPSSGGGGGGGGRASIFGNAKPVDTAAREREVEERLKKEQEKLQRQLEDDRGGRDLRDRPRDK